jgi:hypothetical protein
MLFALPGGRQTLTYWRPVACTIGVLLVTGSGCTAYHWFYKIAPLSGIVPSEDVSSCAADHMDTAFRNITNQDVGENAVAWLEWWKENRSKSQVEWIRDGFTRYGVTVAFQPNPSDTIALLKLLGNEGQSRQVPDFVQYNAFRWLRDSEFNPVEFVLANDASSLDSTTRRGLLEYLLRERSWPRKDNVGGLDFADAEDPCSDSSDTRFTLN